MPPEEPRMPLVSPAPVAAPPPRCEATDDFELWDEGRLQVNRQFAALLRTNGLTSTAAFLAWTGGESVRQVGSRGTTRIELHGANGSETFYLKRHGPPRWKDRIVPLLRFSPAIVG